ncbi:TPA: PerC family transcriptional regulator [Klebsiella variicola subsp. variicola]|nr:PerC family transcriptional regulator [Klebsiella variicola subsp. variicola]
MRIRDSIAERLEASGLYRRAASRWIEVMQRCLNDDDREWIRHHRNQCLKKAQRPPAPKEEFADLHQAAKETQYRMGIAKPYGEAFSCPAKGKRPPSNPFLHGVCLTASSYPACVCAGVSSSPRPVQAQRRRVIYIRGRTRGCAGWRHKCLIRPTSPFAGSNSVGTRKHSATGRYTSDAVPAVVPDGGINALSGLRVPPQAQTA